MNNKAQKSWGEIQLAIAAVALTAMLAFWNLFSTPYKQQAGAQATDTAGPQPADPTEAVTPTPGFVPVKSIFGGTPPKQPVVVQAAAPQSKRPRGGGGPAPRPTANTGSSKP